jgi:hypothetical protein
MIKRETRQRRLLIDKLEGTATTKQQWATVRALCRMRDYTEKNREERKKLRSAM